MPSPYSATGVVVVISKEIKYFKQYIVREHVDGYRMSNTLAYVTQSVLATGVLGDAP